MSAKKSLDQLISEEKASLVRPEDGKDASWQRLSAALGAGLPIPVDVPPPIDPSVGIATGGTSASGAGAAGAAGGASASGGAGAAASTAAAQGIVGSTALKGLAVLALCAGVGVGVAVTRDDAPMPRAPSVHDLDSDARGREVGPALPTPSAEALEPSPHAGSDESTLEPTAATPRPRRPGTNAKNATDDSFDEDLAQLRRAQGALASGKNQKALTILEDPAKDGQRGQLSEDKEAVRTLALCRKGSPDSTKAAKAFLQRYPHSIYEPGIRSTCLNASK